MRVLWFTNNPVNLSAELLSGGWMQALERTFAADPEIELHIATRAREGGRANRREVGGTTYHLLQDKRSLLRKRLDIAVDHEPHKDFLEQYLELIGEIAPDVIHIFGTEMDYGLICEKTTIPVIIHVQGVLNSIYFQLQKINISKFKQIKAQRFIDYIRGGSYGNNLKTLKRRSGNESKILKKCNHVIGRTAWDKRMMTILAPNARYFHCEEMLRKEFFEHTWCMPRAPLANIVSVISSPVYKGHDNIIEACKVMTEAGIAFRWHVIGLEKNTFAFNFFYKAHIASMKDALCFHGPLPSQALIEVLLSASVYVHPSHIENSSNAICEAMALGMPVVALDVGGNASMVRDGEDGLLLPDHDPYSLAAAIKRLATDSVLAQRLGAAAKVRAQARHDPHRIVVELKKIYSELVSSHAS